MSNVDGPANLPVGTIVGRFKILKRIGAGSCGAVYSCIEVSTKKYAALKAELLSDNGNGLKLEVQILKRLKGKKHVSQLISCGKTDSYCYMVVSLLGTSLSTFMRSKKFEFSVSTNVRIFIQMLFALKQIHQIGIVHRDLKPANMTIGRSGLDKKIIYIIDFGLSREFTIIEDNRRRLRKPREKCLFRGTIKYCSAATMEKVEQGRCDDLISLFYICAEINGPLPWHRCERIEEVLKMKKEYSDDSLFEFFPAYIEPFKYTKKLTYNDPPNYCYLFKALKDEMIKNGFKFSDPYEWEECADEFNSSFLPPGYSSKKSLGTVTTQTIDCDTIDKFFDNHFSTKTFGTDKLGF
uniref:non-specific serine/threonine protein kinase n=1 Tax=Strongyloides venezuelensis TaxID=75913 RepID=A0A0K0F230_STRVS